VPETLATAVALLAIVVAFAELAGVGYLVRRRVRAARVPARGDL
jgi:hypothetical protein